MDNNGIAANMVEQSYVKGVFDGLSLAKDNMTPEEGAERLNEFFEKYYPDLLPVLEAFSKAIILTEQYFDSAFNEKE